MVTIKLNSEHPTYENIFSDNTGEINLHLKRLILKDANKNDLDGFIKLNLSNNNDKIRNIVIFESAMIKPINVEPLFKLIFSIIDTNVLEIEFDLLNVNVL